MIVNLTIQNFILIERLSLDFSDGLTVISGETGAGKSIILNAIELIFGKKIETQVARDKGIPVVLSVLCYLSCLKYATLRNTLQEQCINCEEEGDKENDDHRFALLLKRVISPEGRSRFFINGTLSNATQLGHIANTIIEICGQHNSQILLNPKKHIDIIDNYAKLHNQVTVMKKAFSTWKLYEKEVQSLQANAINNEKNKIILSDSYLELKDINPQHNEEETLISRRATLIELIKNKEILENIKENAHNIENLIGSTQKLLSKMPESFTQFKNRIDSTAIELLDTVREMSTLFNHEIYDNCELEEVEQRLSLLKSIARRNNTTPNELPFLLKKFEEQLEQIDNTEKYLLDIQEKASSAKAIYVCCVNDIESQRLMYANKLKDSILFELNDLSMGYIEIEVKYDQFHANEWTENGMGQFSFVLRTSPKFEFSHIIHTVSGGELSRLILAFKIATATTHFTPIIIFDEVDVGLSGNVASKVGKKLHYLVQNNNDISQVFVITHQPQVAAFAQSHLSVQKNIINDNEIGIVVKFLSQENERIDEIARMISGEQITQAARNVAKHLLEQRSK